MMVGNLATWMGPGDQSVGHSLHSRENPLRVVEKVSVISRPRGWKTHHKSSFTRLAQRRGTWWRGEWGIKHPSVKTRKPP